MEVRMFVAQVCRCRAPSSKQMSSIRIYQGHHDHHNHSSKQYIIAFQVIATNIHVNTLSSLSIVVFCVFQTIWAPVTDFFALVEKNVRDRYEQQAEEG
jgi:hypothetical protein